VKFFTALALCDPLHFLDVARIADACGIDGLALPDHVLCPETITTPYPYDPDGRPPFDPSTPWPDPWVAIGAMAAVSTRLCFLTSVYVLPMRNPFLVAKAVGTAAVLSQDRVILGVGVGWMREEFALLGQDFQTRGRRTDEAMGVLRSLWRGGLVEHHGHFYAFDRLQMSPAPRKPVPIWVGGLTEPALRRAARLGDGWISMVHSVREIEDFAARLRALRAECDRADEPFDICVWSVASDIDYLRRLEDVGVSAVLTVPWFLYPGDPASLDHKRRTLERFAEDVLAKWRHC
jgi:probable F420-dependent oxidoreductase